MSKGFETMMETSLKEWEPGVKVMNDLSTILIMGRSRYREG